MLNHERQPNTRPFDKAEPVRTGLDSVDKELITAMMPDGRVIEGVLCTSSAQPGYFWVEHNGRRKTGGRSDRETTSTTRYAGDSVDVDHRDYMVAMARIILREMVLSDVGTTPIE